MRIEHDDFVMGLLCLFFAGALGALAAPTNTGAGMLIALALMLLAIAAIWAARDAHELADETWVDAGRSKRVWQNVLLFLAPIGLGGLAAIAYFAAVRPQLEEQGAGDTAEAPPGGRSS